MGVMTGRADNPTFGLGDHQTDPAFGILDLLGYPVRRHPAVVVDSDGMQPCFAHMAVFALGFQRRGELPVLGGVKHGPIGDIYMTE